MKGLKAKRVYLAFLLILAVCSILPGCSNGTFGGGRWDKPVTVSATVPANGATLVAIGNKLSVTFSGEMSPATINTGTFTVQRGGIPVPGTVYYAGVTADFTPASALLPSTVYTATISTGAKDLNGRALANDYSWSFTTGIIPDTTAPTVTGTINANGATGVALNTKVGATFSEAMDQTTINSQTVTLSQGGTAVPGTVTYSGVNAVFAPAANLTPNTTYTATITTGARDLGGNPLAANFVWSWTTGAAPDTTPPTVTGTIHVNGATNVAINTKVGATFSEGMNPLTITNVNFTLKETVSGAPVAGTVNYSGVSAVFIPQGNLASGTRYTVTVKGGTGGVTDLAGNPMVNDFIISWTTGVAPDTTPPTVVGTIHANGATNIAINTKVGATFSEGLDPLTITNLQFTLRETVSGVPVTGTVGYAGVNALFIPLVNLKSSTSYTVTVKGGPFGVKDLAGNPMTSDFVISWATGAAPDTTPPTVTASIIANGATNVAVNAKDGATFSEGMDPLTVTNINFTLKETVSGVNVAGTVSYSGVNAVFTPLVNLSFSTLYTATVKGGASGVKDLAGNPMASDYAWSWTTGAVLDIISPTVILTIPANIATGVAINSAVKATFSEAMDPLTITNLTFSIAGVSGLVSYDSATKIATFTPSANLAPSTTYTATITTGAKDLAGNPLVSGLAADPWSFTTAAVIIPPPTLTLLTFGIASAGGITNSGATKINGNVVLDPNQTCNAVAADNAGGFGLCGGSAPTKNSGDLVITPTYPDTTTAHSVFADLLVKWNSIKPSGLPGGIVLGCGTIGNAGGAGALIGCSGNSTLPPGTYISASNSTIGISGDLTLNGSPTDVWVFQAPSALTTAVTSRIILTGGAKASNVWWFVGSSATIGTGTVFQGNILSSASISMGTGATSCGRLLAGAEGAGAFTFLGNTVSVPGHTNAPPGCL